MFEYLIMVPANRIGYTELMVGQLKIMQEVITLMVFIPFSMLFMHQPIKLNYLCYGPDYACLVQCILSFGTDEPCRHAA